MALRRIKVGVIGLGEVTQIVHLPILEQLSERFEIGALCDISPGLVHSMGQRYGVGKLYTDARELAEQRDLDAVFVLNSNEYHTECTIVAVNNGKHVLVEKPMCLSLPEVDEIVHARDQAGVQVMVGYMRRFAPAFVQAVEEVKALDKINYARVRDIIGANSLIIEQSSRVHRFDDIPPEAMQDRRERSQRMVLDAIGETPPDVGRAYMLLCGLSSHDISAMREIIGYPKRVVAAAQWNGGNFISAIFEYPGYRVTFETGVDRQRRFDAHIEVYGEHKSVRVQYDTPYIRHMPTTLVIHETVGDSYRESISRPTYKDPYTHELEYFYDVVTNGTEPKTTPEDYKEDLEIFRMIIDAFAKSESDQAT